MVKREKINNTRIIVRFFMIIPSIPLDMNPLFTTSFDFTTNSFFLNLPLSLNFIND